MLEPHPPHSTPHTWRDFFVHIATIVVGLLIAVGIEQTVEYVHRHHELTQIREDLEIEHRQNIAIFKLCTDEFHRQLRVTEGNLASLLLLQQHPGTSTDALPHPIEWRIYHQNFNTSAWQSALRPASTSLVPADEIRRAAAVYYWQERFNSVNLVVADAVYGVRRYTFQDPDPAHLIPAQIDEEIALTKVVLQQLYLQGNTLNNLSLEDPDYANGPTTMELLSMMHDPHPEEGERLLKLKTELHRQADTLDRPGAPSASNAH